VVKRVNNLDNNKPIYLQIREKIEDQIVTGLLKEGDQAPSTNQLVNFYKVNHVTVSKGVNQLVDEGILFKKRGVGMFVAEGAKEKLIQQRKEKFIEDHLIKLVEEANILGITEDELIDLIKRVKGRGMK
jgi:GntR family transcriptional regulator